MRTQNEDTNEVADEMLATDTEPTETDEGETRFHICDADCANWLLRRLGNLDAERRRVQAQAEAICKQLENEASRLRHLYEGELQEWVRRELERRGGRSKSLKLLQGTCAFRAVPMSLRILDEAAAKEYARQTQMPQALETCERLRSGVYTTLAKRALTETGELLPGVDTIPERETFTISFGKSEE